MAAVAAGALQKAARRLMEGRTQQAAVRCSRLRSSAAEWPELAVEAQSPVQAAAAAESLLE